MGQLWETLTRNQKALVALSAVLAICSTGFGVLKSVEPYTPGPMRRAIKDERLARQAADDSSRADRAELRSMLVKVLEGQRRLIDALGLTVEVIIDPSSPEARDAQRRLRRMRRFEMPEDDDPHR